MRDLVIRSGETGKGRSFRGVLLAHATSRALWVQGQSDAVRPIFAMIAVSEAESIPFIRNLQSGNKATLFADDGGRKSYKVFECLKSADYAYVPQRLAEGTVWTVYLPDLFRVDPGFTDPEHVRFCVLPRQEWLAPPDEVMAEKLAQQYHDTTYDDRSTWYAKQAAEEHSKRLAVTTYVTCIADLFQRRLDRHTRCPLIPDRRFAALVLAAMLDAGMAGMSGATSYRSSQAWGCVGSYDEEGMADVGLAPGIQVDTTHAQLEPLLALCVKAYESGESVTKEALYDYRRQQMAA